MFVAYISSAKIGKLTYSMIVSPERAEGEPGARPPFGIFLADIALVLFFTIASPGHRFGWLSQGSDGRGVRQT